MRKIIIGIILVSIACWMVVKKSDLRSFKDDVTASRSLAVSYSGQSISVGDGLKRLAGTDGEIKWSNSEIKNSNGDDAANVEAVVTGLDSRGQEHTASFVFYVNHNTRKHCLERVSLDGKHVDLKDGYKLIVTGSFG